jgi:hypothetical protein
MNHRDASRVRCSERVSPAPAKRGQSGHGSLPPARVPGSGQPSAPIGTFARPCFSAWQAAHRLCNCPVKNEFQSPP